jgi:putative hemolysin
MPDVPRSNSFDLALPLESRLARAALGAARPFLWRALGLRELERLYPPPGEAGVTFESRVLRAFDISIAAPWSSGSIPESGPLIVASNHPTGVADGLVVSELIRRVRPDVRVLANYLLAAIPELRESCFFVDPFGGPTAAARSRAGLRAAHLWLRGGGALVMFPAGEVAADDEARWHESLGRLALSTRAVVLPVFVDARNSRLFYAAGRVHPVLRTALLGRELLNKRGTRIHVRIGQPLAPAGEWPASSAEGRQPPSAAVMTACVREAVEQLRSAPPIDAGLLAEDVEALPARMRLLSSGQLVVYCAPSTRLPHVLPEIGRLREATFRAVGEGTGQAVDLDRFDEHYEHLFVWNRTTREVVGAYRVGRTDRILASHGLAGLYTRTLFRYDERLLQRLGPALELGRAFVRAEYQRSYGALLLLWKGIGRLLASSPDCRVLFGPVSISSRYQGMSQRLLRAFLVQNHLDPSLDGFVDAVNPPAPLPTPARRAAAVTDVAELDVLIQRLEGRGVPVLLRQYLRLNATLLGFNVDPAFGDALDALMMVDINCIPAALRRRYLGQEEAAAA